MVFSKVRERLLKHFLPHGDKKLYWKDILDKRKQSKDESVDEVTADLQKLFSRVNKKMDQEERLLYLIKTLSPALSEYVILGEPKTFDEAVRIAKKREYA